MVRPRKKQKLLKKREVSESDLSSESDDDERETRRAAAKLSKRASRARPPSKAGKATLKAVEPDVGMLSDGESDSSDSSNDSEDESDRKRTAAKLLQRVEQYAAAGQFEKFNHAGRVRGAIAAMVTGAEVSAKTFRDPSKGSLEIVGTRKAGRHEMLSTSHRKDLGTNEVAISIAATARTATALSFLRGPKNEVIIHSGQFVSGKSTKGQPTAHLPFHALPAVIAKITDPIEASAVTINHGLKGLSRARFVRTDKSITGSRALIGGGLIEPPNPKRGEDAGYETDTERGVLSRRIAIAERHLKGSLRALRQLSSKARDATRSPSPDPRRGGTGDDGEAVAILPSLKGLSDAGKAAELMNFAFAPYQLLKR